MSKKTVSNKKHYLREYLEINVDWEGLFNEYKDSWIYPKVRMLPTNGLSSKYITMSIIEDALEFAGYIDKSSDRTWTTILEVKEDLILEKMAECERMDVFDMLMDDSYC